MHKSLWNALLAQMAEQPLPVSIPVHCVSCWREKHTAPFPARYSSCLCKKHAALTWKTWQSRKEVRA